MSLDLVLSVCLFVCKKMDSKTLVFAVSPTILEALGRSGRLVNPFHLSRYLSDGVATNYGQNPQGDILQSTVYQALEKATYGCTRPFKGLCKAT